MDEKELARVERKIERAGTILMSRLSMSFSGRITGVRKLVEELAKQGRVKTETVINAIGPESLRITHVPRRGK